MKLIAEIDESEKNDAIMKRLKQLITENYREPDADGKFEYCTEEVLQELIQKMSQMHPASRAFFCLFLY